jgi:hypothetical protein
MGYKGLGLTATATATATEEVVMEVDLISADLRFAQSR